LTAKTKVFLVLECGSPHGVGHQVATLTQNLNRGKFETTVVYAVRPGTTPQEFERMTRFADHHVYVPEMVRPIHLIKDFGAFLKLYRLMRDEKPDVVHAESSKAGVVARAAAWLAGVPKIFYSPHGYSFLQSDAGPLGRAFYWCIEKSLSGIGSIVACSEGEAVLARKLSWGREVYQVRNLFVMDPPPPPAPPTKPNAVVVGALGRLTRARNPEAFVRLAQGLAKHHPEARFLWVGGGELEAKFRELVEKSGLRDRFEITGHISREKVLEKLMSMDVFVHYSLWEGGAPIAMHEAMFCGKPVLASNIAGNVDLVVPGVTGFLAGNEAELLARAVRLVESADLRAELGRNAKDYLRREVSVERSVAALERLYSSQA
jgi:glycosyltransferase involved in cell wall biosynthesis